jgi:ribonuclease J
VSGHPRKEEMEDLYSWLRPLIAVPVHGEALHLKEHAKLATKMGATHVKLLDDGDMLLLDAVKPMVIEKVPAGKLYKDGNILIEAAQRTMPERRKLAESGVIACAIVVDERGEIMTDPEIELCGFPEATVQGETFQTHLENALDDILDNLSKARLRDPDLLRETAYKTLRGKANMLWGKKPVVMVQILVV